MINIGGNTLEITSNLAAFIHSYLSSDVARKSIAEYLWIDQICIDQNSVSEKNQQIPLMSRIFTQAEEVIAWIGTEAEDSLAYMDTDDFRQYVDTAQGRIRRSLRTLRALFGYSYWSRLWVQQELVLAKRVLFAAGNIWLPASQLIATIDQPIWGAEAGFTARKAIVKDQGEAELLSVYEALREFSRKDCKEPNDKVYGLLAMVKPEEQLHIQVDRSLTPKEVFEMPARNWIMLQKNSPGLIRSKQGIGTFYLLGEGMGLDKEEIRETYHSLYVEPQLASTANHFV